MCCCQWRGRWYEGKEISCLTDEKGKGAYPAIKGPVRPGALVKCPQWGGAFQQSKFSRHHSSSLLLPLVLYPHKKIIRRVELERLSIILQYHDSVSTQRFSFESVSLCRLLLSELHRQHRLTGRAPNMPTLFHSKISASRQITQCHVTESPLNAELLIFWSKSRKQHLVVFLSFVHAILKIVILYRFPPLHLYRPLLYTAEIEI
jgi:hypothetical protein